MNPTTATRLDRRPRPAPADRSIQRLAAENRLGRGATIVCVLTGSGLKDPKTAEASVDGLLIADPTAAAVAETLGW